MPIVTRTIDAQPSAAGTVFASFLAIDAKDRPLRRSRSRFANEAAAVVASDSFDWTSQLEDLDFADLLAWVQAKNGSDVFDYTDRDITELDGEELLLVWFATTLGNEAISIAWWVNNFNPPQYNTIRDRVGIDPTTGSRIQDRAIDLEVAEPSFDAVEDVG